MRLHIKSYISLNELRIDYEKHNVDVTNKKHIYFKQSLGDEITIGLLFGSC